MNKEIEELLNTMKDKDCYYVGTNGCLYQDLTKEEIGLLLSYIEQLETDYKEVNESVTWWTNRFNAIERDNRNLKNNKDKAIEYIEKDLQISILPNNQIINGTEVVKRINKIEDILKGDSDE